MRLVIDAEVDGALRMIGDIEQRLASTVGVLRILADEIHTYERDMFASAGNGQWAPDSPVTVDLKGSGQALIDTGGLLQAMTTNAAYEGDAVRVITTRRGAAYNQRGAHGAPPRDPAPEPPAHTVEAWSHRVLEYVVHGV